MATIHMNSDNIFIFEGPGKSSTARVVHRQLINKPDIDLPFPPKITLEDLITPKKNGVKSKTGNCFLIYRQVYVRELQTQGYSYPMTGISKFVSNKWKAEKAEVVQFYKELAMNANKLHKKTFGDVPVYRSKKNAKKHKKNQSNSQQDCKEKAKNEDNENAIPSPSLSSLPNISNYSYPMVASSLSPNISNYSYPMVTAYDEILPLISPVTSPTHPSYCYDDYDYSAQLLDFCYLSPPSMTFPDNEEDGVIAAQIDNSQIQSEQGLQQTTEI